MYRHFYAIRIAPPTMLTWLLFLAGCSVGPDYHRPEITLPQAWNVASQEVGSPQVGSLQVGAVTTPTELMSVRWWSVFNDPVLDSLIAEASTENLSLNIALSRIREARGQRKVTIGAILPQPNSAAEYRRERLSQGADFPVPEAFDGDNFYRAGFDASWEIDVFGGLRRDIESASADLQAQTDAARDVLVSVLAEVSENYIELRTTQTALAVARKNVAAQRKSLELTQLRIDAGMGTRLDVSRAEALLAQTESEVPRLEADERALMHGLAILLGKNPTELLEQLAKTSPIDPSAITGVGFVSPASLPVGVPAEILRRRPDVRQAEQRIVSANAQIGVATADLFPKFNITADIGVSTRESSDLAKKASTYWSAGPLISWPILQANTILSNIEIQEERQIQAVLEYQSVVLNSLREVEDALIRLHKEQERSRDLQRAVAANEVAVGLAKDSYQQGLVDFLNVLQTESDLFAAETSYVRSVGEVSKTVVALYKALGGGWETKLPESDGLSSEVPQDVASEVSPVVPNSSSNSTDSVTAEEG